ncbi:hypothetical protein GO491_03200 [Flavobacteriaceae bacterium Ap0902]|nr:hypothetical protein [Flavobacteriaceae bacterium Ap0902]
MKALLLQLQERIAEISDIKYVDEDWGQLDYYSPNMPVQWPCCLIDIQSVDYSNLGIDLNKTPKNRQNARIQIAFTLANMKLTNTSMKAHTFWSAEN